MPTSEGTFVVIETAVKRGLPQMPSIRWLHAFNVHAAYTEQNPLCMRRMDCSLREKMRDRLHVETNVFAFQDNGRLSVSCVGQPARGTRRGF